MMKKTLTKEKRTRKTVKNDDLFLHQLALFSFAFLMAIGGYLPVRQISLANLEQIESLSVSMPTVQDQKDLLSALPQELVASARASAIPILSRTESRIRDLPTESSDSEQIGTRSLINPAQLVALAFLGDVSRSTESLIDNLRGVKEMLFDNLKIPAENPNIEERNPKQARIFEAQNETPKQTKASVANISEVIRPFDLNSLRAELMAEIEEKFKNYTPAQTLPAITRQSDADAGRRSTIVTNITQSGILTNPTLTGATVSGPTGTFTSFNFTTAAGTSATTTSFFSTTASSTNLFFTTATGGNFTSSGLGTFSNLLATGSSTLQNFTFSTATGTSATTTNFFTTTASSTNLFATTATVGSLCLSGTCNTSWPAGSPFPFTATSYGVSTSTTLGLLNGFLSTASSTIDSNLTVTGNMGIGTSTPAYVLSSFSSSAPQLALSAGAGIAQWTFRNAGGNLYFATTTVAGTATTTLAALSINGSTGALSLGGGEGSSIINFGTTEILSANSGGNTLRLNQGGYGTIEVYGAQSGFKFSNNVAISRNTSDGSDSGVLQLAGGGSASNSRGAFIEVHGNEAGSTGRIRLFTGNNANGAVLFINNSSGTMFEQSGSDGTTTFTSSGSGAWNFNSTYVDGSRISYQDDGVTVAAMGSERQLTGAGSASNGAFYATTWPTTASAANAYVADANTVRRSTSSRRWKTDITYLTLTDVKDAVMKLRPVTYRGIGATDNQRLWPGFIAEDIQEFAPILDTYDNDIYNGTPNYVMYDRVAAFLVPVIQDHEIKLSLLAGTLTASSTPESLAGQESFVTAFFDNLFSKVRTWLADAANGITKIVTGVIESDKSTTDLMCVKKADGTEVCLTGEQLESLIASAGSGSTVIYEEENDQAPIPNDQSSPNEDSNEETATSTPNESTIAPEEEVIEEPILEPEPEAEAVPAPTEQTP